MAKVAFTKLKLQKKQEVKIVEYNDSKIEVKTYLPVNEKLKLISDVINSSADENNFANPVKVDLFTKLAIIEYYTNITFTEKQKENPANLYDLFEESGLLNDIIAVIPADEIYNLYQDVELCTEAVYKYKNSVMGILEAISTDYEGLNMDIEGLYKKLNDKENVEFLGDVLTKLG